MLVFILLVLSSHQLVLLIGKFNGEPNLTQSIVVSLPGHITGWCGVKSILGTFKKKGGGYREDQGHNIFFWDFELFAAKYLSKHRDLLKRRQFIHSFKSAVLIYVCTLKSHGELYQISTPDLFNQNLWCRS